MANSTEVEETVANEVSASPADEEAEKPPQPQEAEPQPEVKAKSPGMLHLHSEHPFSTPKHPRLFSHRQSVVSHLLFFQITVKITFNS